MADFDEWCDETDDKVGVHDLTLLQLKENGFDVGLEKIADIVPEQYASRDRLSRIMRRFGKPAAAKYLAEKLPTLKTARSGDIGEIIATSYIEERTYWDESVNKLRWKDSREMALRGDDMLALGINVDEKAKFLKGESKSRAALKTKTVEEARTSLNAHDGLPTPHSLSYLSDRFADEGRDDLSDLIDDMQLKQGIKSDDVTHMIFAVSGNDPTNFLTTDLGEYAGEIDQFSVGMHLPDHQAFIAGVYEKVLSDGDA